MNESKQQPPAIMFLGTTSNAGKSILTAGLCRALARRGFSAAPFKAQNMSLNSWVTDNGGEMGIAQAVQALACGLTPSALMNPVLLKPLGAQGSQIIIMGRPVGAMPYSEYVKHKPQIWKTVVSAYAELSRNRDIMVLEGAGSPAEINLRAHDIVNLRMARHARARALLVADIDRGGAFAALAGTMALLGANDRKLISAFILNKFRGEAALLSPALEKISRRCRRPFAGVMPHIPDLRLPDEDSVTLCERAASGPFQPVPPGNLDVAVLSLPAISNITDWDPLLAEPRLRVRMASSPSDLGNPHILIIPGSRNVPESLRHLRQTGLDKAITALAARMRQTGRGQIVGICAGLQILGISLVDRNGLECRGKHAGLGLMPLSTSLEPQKTLRRHKALASASLCGRALPCFGQEIHHGQCETSALPVISGMGGEPLGWSAESPARIWGTWLHGVFECDEFRHAWLDLVASEFNLDPVASATYNPDAELDRLADAVEENLDMAMILSWLAPQQ